VLLLRLLAFNVLLVFLPVAGLLLFGPYERQLLESQERSMVQQGRLLAAALAARGEVTAESAHAVLEMLGRRNEARLRIVDRDGNLLADSSLLGPRREEGGAPRSDDESGARDNPLYAIGALPFALWNRLAGSSQISEAEPSEYYATARRLAGPEVLAALGGRYGAATRIAPGPARAVILYSAIPIRVDDEVEGAVLISQSTIRILAELYEVRLRVFGVFMTSLLAAALLSLYVAGTISRPLRALASEARALVDGHGRLRGRFRGSRRSDEIGELARSLEELTRRLAERQEATEAFAADVTHQLKNPLASIRGATEMLSAAATAEERSRFGGIVEQEVARMERLLAGVRDIVQLDRPETAEERQRVDVGALARQLVDSFSMRGQGPVTVRPEGARGAFEVDGSPERIAVVLENLIDNAISFSPVGVEVEVELERSGHDIRIDVRDRGPGIPPEHLERVFDRFFTYRPEERAESHSGLGLAIVRAVVQSHGGSVAIANRDDGGTSVVVTLPAA